MEVIKRDGRKQPVRFDKITARIKKLAYGLDPMVDVTEVAQKVCAGVYNGVRTSELDELAAQTAAYMSTRHHDYSLLASRIAASNLHKNTTKSFSETVQLLYNNFDQRTGERWQVVTKTFCDDVMSNAAVLDDAIIYDRDFSYNYFAFKTLERSYLLRANGKVVERPQHMLMRVAVGIHGRDIERVLETYELLSMKNFIHASPSLFNAGVPLQQLASCFLLDMVDDSIDGIFETLKRCAVISKGAGGIGLAVHKVRAAGSRIRSSSGSSNGLVPMLRVFNNAARYVDQSGGKRKGAVAIYLEPWHADVFEFLNLRKNHGKEEQRARDLFYAMWVPDLFMKRVESDSNWSLFCPNEAPGLADVWGPDFEALYTAHEENGLAREVIPARKLWFAILESQMETGTPYMVYKDSCNGKSNQKHLGTIKCSNLCSEIVEFTSPNEVAVCNLASISLPQMIEREEEEGAVFNHQRLRKIVNVVTRNLNKVIDRNQYPLPEAENSNSLHRPLGIGVQGLADVFILLRYPFDSLEARKLNKEIFETIYFAALEASCELASEEGTYASYEGSPASKGILQFDMWNVEPSDKWDWTALREKIRLHGLRNSLLVAPMPTASTSQILGNNECFEPYTSNIYHRRVLAGEFTVVNQHLLRDLQELGLWNTGLKNRIIEANGSIQGIAEIPEDIRNLYKTVWEISQKSLLEMSADRGAFIDQSQSLNVHIAAPNIAKLSSMHFYGWKLGLKTGMYYLRTKPATDAIKFTVDRSESTPAPSCSLRGGPDCTSCGS